MRSKALVVAYAVHESGCREVIGIDLGEVARVRDRPEARALSAGGAVPAFRMRSDSAPP